MARNDQTKYVKFTFETAPTCVGDTVRASLQTVRFSVPTDDALVAIKAASEAAEALFRGLSFKVKTVDVNNYGD